MAQPLIKATQANARAVRAARIPSAFAEHVDGPDNRQANRYDGRCVFGAFQQPGARKKERDAPPCGVFTKAGEDVVEEFHLLGRGVKAYPASTESASWLAASNEYAATASALACS